MAKHSKTEDEEFDWLTDPWVRGFGYLMIAGFAAFGAFCIILYAIR